MPMLQDRVAVITGGTGVLGRAASRLLVAEGARVAVPYRNDEDAQALRAEVDARADALLAERVDATDGAALTRFIDGAVAVFGHLDALVNVIGGFAGGQPLHETDEATWDHMMDLNLRSVYLACHAAVPHLLHTDRGAIVNVSSRAAVVPAPNFSAYAVSKAGVVTLTSVLALELKDHGITVKSVLLQLTRRAGVLRRAFAASDPPAPSACYPHRSYRLKCARSTGAPRSWRPLPPRPGGRRRPQCHEWAPSRLWPA